MFSDSIKADFNNSGAEQKAQDAKSVETLQNVGFQPREEKNLKFAKKSLKLSTF